MRLQDFLRLVAVLNRRSRKICLRSGCKQSNYRCDSYAYLSKDGQLLTIGTPQSIKRSAEPCAALLLPWRGTFVDMVEKIAN